MNPQTPDLEAALSFKLKLESARKTLVSSVDSCDAATIKKAIQQAEALGFGEPQNALDLFGMHEFDYYTLLLLLSVPFPFIYQSFFPIHI